MILSRAPLRISFFGGGSDLPAYYSQSDLGGSILSTAIDKYMYIALIETPKPHIKLMYSEIEIVDSISKLKHDIVQASLRHNHIERGIEIGSFADIPTMGTGLGSSSSFAVALLNGLNCLMHGIDLHPRELAKLACTVEIDLCKKPIGIQDQLAAAHGGTNYYHISQAGDVDITPIGWGDLVDLDFLNQNLMLFYTDTTRSANEILSKQTDAMQNKVQRSLVDRMVHLTRDAYDNLIVGEYDTFGSLLDETWNNKRQLVQGITSENFDEIYRKAKDAGALGGKLLGAGGGGYFLFYVHPENQERVALAVGLEQMKCNINAPGAEIVYNSEESFQVVTNTEIY